MLAISTLFGLPAHALLVHAAVVLVPLAVVVFAATCWKEAWRTRYSLLVAAVAVGAASLAFLAKQSGEPLKDSVRRAAEGAGLDARFGEHPEQGDTAFVLAAVFAAGTIGVWAISKYRERFGMPAWAPMAAYVAVLIPAAFALLTIIQAGHSGAVLVWKDLGTFAAN